MSNKQQIPFIHCRSDNSVKISGGLVFCKSPWLDESVDNLFIEHEISGIHFYRKLPRWYQLRQWLRLIRLMRKHTN